MNRVLCATAVALGLAACSPGHDGTHAPEIRVGVLALEGEPYEHISGRPTLNGARMAAEEINARGGVVVAGVPHRVRLVTAGHADQSEDAASKALHLLNLDSVHVLVGPQVSRHAIPVARLANDARVPMVSPMSSNPETTADKPFVFRIASRDDALSGALARFALDELGERRAALITDRTDPYSRDLSSSFSRIFRQGGGTDLEVSLAGASAGSDQIDEALRALHAAGMEVLFAPVRMEIASTLLRRTDALGFRFTFLGSDSWDITKVMALPAAEGALVAHQYHHELRGPEPRRFVEQYRRTHGELPRSTAAMTYDAVMVLAAAIEQASSTDGRAIRDALAGLPPFEGATGRIVFHGTGDPERGVVLTGIRGGDRFIRHVSDPEP